MVEQHQQNVIQQQYNANEALKKEIERKQLAVVDTEKTDKISDREKKKNTINMICRRIKSNSRKRNNKQSILIKAILLILVDRRTIWSL